LLFLNSQPFVARDFFLSSGNPGHFCAPTAFPEEALPGQSGLGKG